MTAPDRYAVRYVEADGSHTHGPDCKNWGCAVLTIVPFDTRLLDAIVINGAAHALRDPVPAMAYLLQNRAVAEGMVAAIDAHGAATRELAPTPMTDEGCAYRMDAYYYGFVCTGIDAIDLILSAVACAGKAFHNTEDWTENSRPWHGRLRGRNPVEWIQNAAADAAAVLQAAPRNGSTEEPSRRAEQAYVEGALEWLARECDSAEGLGSEAIAKRIRAILAEQRRPAPAAPVPELEEANVPVPDGAWLPGDITPDSAEADATGCTTGLALYMAAPEDGGPNIRQGRYDHPLRTFIDSTTATSIEPDLWSAPGDVTETFRAGELALGRHTAPAMEVDEAMVERYLAAQRAAIEEADQFGRPNAGGLHRDTVREACRKGLTAALGREGGGNG